MTPLGTSLRTLVLVLGLAGVAAAQGPAPTASGGRAADVAVANLAALGERQLEREDPVEALETFGLLLQLDPRDVAALVGAGRARLLVGDVDTALEAAQRALRIEPEDDAARALEVRALIRARRFDDAVAVAELWARRGHVGPELLAARASALFRVGRNDEAARLYRDVLRRDADCAEAHLRLGSGLTEPRPAPLDATLLRGVAASRSGDLDAALGAFRTVLDRDPGHPIAHRLIGETLFRRQAEDSMVVRDPAFARLAALVPAVDVDPALADSFLPGIEALSPSRRAVAERALALFASMLPRLLARGGRHDLLGEDERTTDDPARASLRGRRTFDGRVWDDVRGIGGLRAATGVEALDEAATWGFDTLAHEIAHQVHLHGLPRRSLGIRVRELYDAALEHDRCLDYYAASNFAEYFGQGVEAFVSLAKRPAVEPTHGHTRFELLRRDPALHALIAELVDVDPLGPTVPAAQRDAILDAAIDCALRTGRFDDARTALSMLANAELAAAAAARIEATAVRLERVGR